VDVGRRPSGQIGDIAHYVAQGVSQVRRLSRREFLNFAAGTATLSRTRINDRYSFCLKIKKHVAQSEIAMPSSRSPTSIHCTYKCLCCAAYVFRCDRCRAAIDGMPGYCGHRKCERRVRKEQRSRDIKSPTIELDAVECRVQHRQRTELLFDPVGIDRKSTRLN